MSIQNVVGFLSVRFGWVFLFVRFGLGWWWLVVVEACWLVFFNEMATEREKLCCFLSSISLSMKRFL